MLSKRIRFIVLIVSCSLTGIFLFQAYWLYNSYKVSTKQFNNSFLEILEKLQQRHASAEVIAHKDYDKENADFLAALMVARANKDTRPIVMPKQLADQVSKKPFPLSIPDSLSAQITKDRPSLKAEQQYHKKEFISIEKALRSEIDTLLKTRNIQSPFAFKLSNFNDEGDHYISNATLYKNSKDSRQVVLGVAKPYKLQLAIGNQLGYVIGQMQWILVSSLLMIAITVWAFIYMFRTIFQQKRLSEIKTDFVNNMTHEFKTPLATVSIAIEAMKSFNVLNNPQQAREYLDICEHELKRVSGMVEKVLRVAAFEKSDIRIFLKKTNIRELLNDVVLHMRPQIEQKGAHLAIESSHGKVEAMIDPDHFLNVVHNLIDNSLKYAKGNPNIVVTYGKNESGDQMLVTVSDKGIGIPSIYKDQIFESFFRVPTGNIHTIKGFGLGLSYVAAIVEKHKGHIKVKSMEDQGTSITIYIPISP